MKMIICSYKDIDQVNWKLNKKRLKNSNLKMKRRAVARTNQIRRRKLN